ncbi:MAG: nucleotide sugar dehydrogenase [Thermoprotei archaeon]|nr:nucleotide sugar dehydrogenase [Thermoprotei archaeon]
MTRIMDLRTQEEVIRALKMGEMKLAVMGLGWMGLPTACLYAKAGVHVIGIDISEDVVKAINSGRCHLEAEPELKALVKELVSRGTLRATSDVIEGLRESDVVIVVVPTLIKEGKPDYSALTKAAEDLGNAMKPGSLIIVESTVGPGVTEGLFARRIQEIGGLRPGVDYGLAYSPIRAMAGRALRDIQNYPRILGAVDERSFLVAEGVLRIIVKGGIVGVSNIMTAEAVKLAENVYRDVNIALVNELAKLFERIGVDVYEVIRAANTQPYAHLHIPGIGVGGHCIPVNPYFLLDVANSHGIELKLVKEARRVNDSMPDHAISLLTRALRRTGRRLSDAKVAILGLSYRGNVKEHRYSPTLRLYELLKGRAREVVIYDPYYTAEELERLGLRGTDTLEDAVKGASCIIIATDHDDFRMLDFRAIARLANEEAVLLEGRPVIDRPEVVVSSGLRYVGIGRPATWIR